MTTMAPRLTPRAEREIAASNARDDVLAAKYGVSRRTIRRIQVEGPRAGTRREAFEDDVAIGWKADCMEPDEWAEWVAKNPIGIGDNEIADRPCRDCPLSFAAEMRAEGRCNGTPGWHPPADDHEERA